MSNTWKAEKHNMHRGAPGWFKCNRRKNRRTKVNQAIREMVRDEAWDRPLPKFKRSDLYEWW